MRKGVTNKNLLSLFISLIIYFSCNFISIALSQEVTHIKPPPRTVILANHFFISSSTAPNFQKRWLVMMEYLSLNKGYVSSHLQKIKYQSKGMEQWYGYSQWRSEEYYKQATNTYRYHSLLSTYPPHMQKSFREIVKRYE